MADQTKIEWTDATWNPITGCSVVSPGCTNCYAMGLAGTRLKHHPSRQGLTVDTKAGPVWNGEVRLNEQWLDQPLRWTRPRMIFVCAHGDLFHESVPDAWIDRVFAVMALCPQHTFQVLTKRSARMRAYLTRPAGDGKQDLRNHIAWVETARVLNAVAPNWGSEGIDGKWRSRGIQACTKWPLPNLWLGVSCEDQTRADARIPDLLATPAAVRFVSAEPLLGPIDFTAISWLSPLGSMTALRDGADEWERACLDWIIVGGESGPKARPMPPPAVRSILRQCASAGVPFFFKQWGEWAPVLDGDGAVRSEGAGSQGARLAEGRWEVFGRGAGHGDVFRVGKKAAGRLLDGVEHNGMPEARLVAG